MVVLRLARVGCTTLLPQGSAHGFELICSTIKLRSDAREEIGIYWDALEAQDWP